MPRRRKAPRPAPPATPAQIQRGCTSKAAYYSWAQARAVALNIRATQRIPVYAYECRFCGNFHLGHNYDD